MSYACDFDEIAPLPNIIDSLSLLLEVFQSLKFRAWSRASTIIPTMIGPLNRTLLAWLFWALFYSYLLPFLPPPLKLSGPGLRHRPET